MSTCTKFTRKELWSPEHKTWDSEHKKATNKTLSLPIQLYKNFRINKQAQVPVDV